MALDFNWHQLSITVRVLVRTEFTQKRPETLLNQTLLGPDQLVIEQAARACRIDRQWEIDRANRYVDL